MHLRLALAGVLVGASVLSVSTVAHAAAGTLAASGITSPGGQVTMGTHLWVADHALGFCRVDFPPPAAVALNQNTCADTAKIVSPGQPTFDASHNVVYVPDNSAKSQGVWRLTFDPATETVGNLTLLAGGGGGLAGNRATATALGPDGSLYVGFLRRGLILRVTTPDGPTQVVQPVASTSDTRGISAMAFVGPDLYLAEGGAITKVANAATCSACKAVPTTSSAAAPTALASDGKGILYIADTPAARSNILRFTLPTATCAAGTEDILTSVGAFPDGSLAEILFATGLSVDNAGTLSIGDDPSGGAQIIQGHVWQVANAATAPAESPGACGQPPTPIVIAAGPAGTLAASGITSPGGQVVLGTHLWVADHALGFCRVDSPPPAAVALNQNTCADTAKLVSPGQPSTDGKFVYIPDNSAKSQGVWRLSFDPATETVGNLTLLAGGAGGLAGNRATATALGPDGNLYVGFLRNGNILRVTNPSGTTQLVQTVATTSDGRGLSALAFVGPDLYAAEGGAVTKVANAASCSACKAVATTSSAVAPTALASDGKSVLYIAETPAIDSTVLRFNVATGAEITFSNTGVFPDGTTTSYKFVTGLSVDNTGNLFVGDDPTDGAQIIQGHVWKVLTN